MPPGVGVSGLESDGGDQFFCGGGSSGKVRAVRRPKQSGCVTGRGPHVAHRGVTARARPIPGNRSMSQEAALQAYGLYPDDGPATGLGRKLAAASEKPSLPWSFKVVDDASVNAFALPGGYIYVTRGLMTHLRTEAELVSVLGHEIGHVTGRHSASQMSKQQLAMGGLIVGMMVEPELQRFGGLAQQGLGVLFLKFGRDHENEADELGLRYMTREEYDPREMIEVFGVLDRVGRAEGGAGRMPEWLSTHPNPGNRQTNIQEEIAKTGATGSVVNRDAYLRHLDGMVFGDNPREGYFVGQAFYHPDLRFQLAFPRGFKTQNQRQAVAGVSEGQDAMVALTLTAGSSPEEAARKFLSQQGLQAGRTGRDTIGGLPAYEAFFEVATEQGALRGQVAFVAYDSKMYRLLAYTLGRAVRVVPEGVRRGDPQLRSAPGGALPGRPAQAHRSREAGPRDGARGVRPRLSLDGRERDDRAHQRRRREPAAGPRPAGQARRGRPPAGLSLRLLLERAEWEREKPRRAFQGSPGPVGLLGFAHVL
jgi:predicted Zn-dependent protease